MQSPRSPLSTLILVLITSATAWAQAAPPVDADGPVREAVAAVSAGRLRADLTRLVAFGTRHTRSDTTSDTRGIGAARRWLLEQLAAISSAHGDRLQVERRAHVIPAGRRMPEPTELVNVVGTLPGRDPDRVVIVSGHYDSRNGSDEDVAGDAPGANDDGSGTVAVLEAARVITALLHAHPELQPRASIRFACVAGEEQGLYGSRAMAQADREAGVDVVGMITNDIVGGVDGGNGRFNRGLVRLFSEGVPSSKLGPPVIGSDNDGPSRQLARTIAETAARHVPSLSVQLVFRQDRYLRGGDHRAYNDEGYAAVRFTDMYEHFDRQHQDVRDDDGRAYGDALEYVDFVNLAAVTRANVAAILQLALAPAAPRRVGVDISGLSHDTRLVWDAPAEPGDVAGYRVRLRATHAPTWERTIDVGAVHLGPDGALLPRAECTLPGVSKDDQIAAVEAYDAQGFTSVPVYPQPWRE